MCMCVFSVLLSAAAAAAAALQSDDYYYIEFFIAFRPCEICMLILLIN